MGKHWDRMTLRDQLQVTHSRSTLMREAVPFVISDNALSTIVRAVESEPQFVLDNIQFARPPFERMWIEFGLAEQRSDGWISRSHGPRVGYLISPCSWEGGIIFTAFGTNEHGMPYTSDSGFEIALAGEHPAASRVNYGVERDQWLKANCTAFAPDSLRHKVTHDSVMAAAKRLSYYSLRGDKDTVAPQAEVIMLLGMLLAINQPSSITTLTDVPKVRGIAKGKPVQYFGHTQVDIVVGQEPRVLRRDASGTHAHPRWHQVRGHWFHRGGERGCAHDWVQSDESTRFVCASCGRKRTWREYPDGRGDAGKGYIQQHRRIRTPQDIST